MKFRTYIVNHQLEIMLVGFCVFTSALIALAFWLSSVQKSIPPTWFRAIVQTNSDAINANSERMNLMQERMLQIENKMDELHGEKEPRD